MTLSKSIIHNLIRLTINEIYSGDILGKPKNVWIDKNRVEIKTIRVDSLVNLESTGLTELYETIGKEGCGFIRLNEKGRAFVKEMVRRTFEKKINLPI